MLRFVRARYVLVLGLIFATLVVTISGFPNLEPSAMTLENDSHISEDRPEYTVMKAIAGAVYDGKASVRLYRVNAPYKGESVVSVSKIDGPASQASQFTETIERIDDSYTRETPGVYIQISNPNNARSIGVIWVPNSKLEQDPWMHQVLNAAWSYGRVVSLHLIALSEIDD